MKKTRNGKTILLKTFMKLTVRETETIIKISLPAYCPITRASNNSHFHSSHFIALHFPSQYQWFFLSLLPFLILEIKNNCVQSHSTTRTEPRVVRSTKLSPVLRDSYLDGWPKTNTPCGKNFFFFIPFWRRYLRLQNFPALCDVASSISQLFVPHCFAMSAFACIFTISYNRTNKQWHPSFEFFSVLLTFGRLKQ